MKIKNYKDTPVCSFIFVLIIVVFSLYFTNAIKNVPCEKDMKSIFISNFIHTDFVHLLSNLYGIYALSRVEYKVGFKKFFSLIIFLLIFNTIFEIILHRIIKTPCSIGFSGILYGITTFEIVCNDTIDYNMIGAIILNISVSKIFDKKSSLSGHIIGGISGILGGVLFKRFGNCL